MSQPRESEFIGTTKPEIVQPQFHNPSKFSPIVKSSKII